MSEALKDLGKCVSWKCEEMGGEPGRLVALVSDDGTTWHGEACPRCGTTWCFNVPKSPLAGVASMTESELKALRDSMATVATKTGDGPEVA